MAAKGPNPIKSTSQQDASSSTHAMLGFDPTTLTEVPISQQMPSDQVDALLRHNSDRIDRLETTMRYSLDLSNQELNVLQIPRRSIGDARGHPEQRDEQEIEQTSSSPPFTQPVAPQVVNLTVAPSTLPVTSTGINTFIVPVVQTLPQVTHMRDVYTSPLPDQYGVNSSPMTSYPAPPHGIFHSQGFANPPWTSYPFPAYGGQPESSSYAHPTMSQLPYPMPYSHMWPGYGHCYPPYGVPPYGLPTMHASSLVSSSAPPLPPPLPPPMPQATSSPTSHV